MGLIELSPSQYPPNHRVAPSCFIEGFLMLGSQAIQFAPSEALRPYIESYALRVVTANIPFSAYQLNEAARIDFILEGRLDIGETADALIPFAWPIVHGASSHARFHRSRAARIFSINLTPIGWSRFWSKSAKQFADTIRPLSDLIGGDAQELRRSLAAATSASDQHLVAERYFLGLLECKEKREAAVRAHAVQSLIVDTDICSVEQISESLEMGNARLVRLCRRAFGFAPKLLLSRRRFFRMLEQLEVRPYCEWRDFLDPHYVDQSHFIRDFKRFTGMAPSQFMTLARPNVGAVALKLAA
jgi:AraC-like DNA-binding protein